MQTRARQVGNIGYITTGISIEDADGGDSTGALAGTGNAICAADVGDPVGAGTASDVGDTGNVGTASEMGTMDNADDVGDVDDVGDLGNVDNADGVDDTGDVGNMGSTDDADDVGRGADDNTVGAGAGEQRTGIVSPSSSELTVARDFFGFLCAVVATLFRFFNAVASSNTSCGLVLTHLHAPSSSACIIFLNAP